jgi:hypothetical protein
MSRKLPFLKTDSVLQVCPCAAFKGAQVIGGQVRETSRSNGRFQYPQYSESWLVVYGAWYSSAQLYIRGVICECRRLNQKVEHLRKIVS